MTKVQLLEIIRKTAEANGGTPLGVRRFYEETGLKESHWNKHWPRYSDAVREAGYVPNQLESGYGRSELLEKYAKVAMSLGRLPTRNDLRFKEHNDPEFPTTKTFERLGTKLELVVLLRDFCRDRKDYEPVVRMCDNYTAPRSDSPLEVEPNQSEDGFVYLAKSGRFFKIGKTNAPGRRDYELGIQLPEKLLMVHVIRTDDPDGIEAYWHRRFAQQRQNGEWFSLTATEVAAFKRRKKFM